ncbi:MAG: HAD family phosphatase [Planctomycetia bacterium]|nr:HAD family phosphatase [Planctomycetia bacterium]
MSIRTIIFDFGNVIGFFDHRRATRRIAEQTGLPEELLFQTLLDFDLEDPFEAGLLTSAEVFTRLRATWGTTTPDELLDETLSDIFWPNPEICDLVPRLRGRYRLLLGSNTNELHARRFRREFAEVLGHLDELVLSFEIGARKPRPAFFEHCHRRAGCAPDECLFIDDLEANIAGAKAVGLQGVVYRHGEQFPERLRALGVEW